MTDRTRAAALTAAYYGVVFFGFGAMLPYWPVWLEAEGLSAADIGFLMGATTLVRIASTTLLPALADRFAMRRKMLAWTAAASAVMAVGMALMPLTPATVLAASLAWAFVLAPAVPLGEALGLRAAGQFQFSYPKVRAAGSVGFLLANLGVGAALAPYGPDIVLWVVAGSFAVLAVLGALHPGGGAAPGSGADRPEPGELRALLMQPALVIFALAAAATQSSHMVYYSYSVLDWQAQGIDGAVIGQLWAFGVFAEIVLMLGPGRRLVAWLGPAGALALGSLAGITRWVAMALEPGLGWLWPLQALHAVSFGIAHLGAMAFIAAAIPPRISASAQGVVSGVCTGGLSALVLFAAGAVVGPWGIAGGYWLVGAVSGLGLGLAVLLMVTWRGTRLLPD